MRAAAPGRSAQVQGDEAIARALQEQEYHKQSHRAPTDPRHASGGHAASAGHAASSGHAERQLVRDEQLRMALEANPEAFVSVPMLYVNCTLNDVPLKAFVDTGAQMTVMSLQTAQRCKLGPLIDQRFRGVAAGVGTARLIGRVHMATLRLGKSSAVDTAITVLEQRGGPELLLGLDVRAARGRRVAPYNLAHLPPALHR